MLNSKKTAFLILALVITGVFFSLAAAVDPNGASLSNEVSTRAPNDTADSSNASAGNLTYMDIYGFSTTQSWQGYYGNVTGSIQLADANDKSLYNWSLASPSGEVYAATNATFTWSNIQCFNFTANGLGGDESGLGGTTNLNGTNLTTLEARFNVGGADNDGVNETFVAQDHSEFYAASQQFSANECQSTSLFDGTGTSNSGNFTEVLLYEPVSTTLVFASLLESNLMGFDNSTYDFEMLVLEDGHGSDVATTQYFFWVELE
jgi:hypothetical protein